MHISKLCCTNWGNRHCNLCARLIPPRSHWCRMGDTRSEDPSHMNHRNCRLAIALRAVDSVEILIRCLPRTICVNGGCCARYGWRIDSIVDLSSKTVICPHDSIALQMINGLNEAIIMYMDCGGVDWSSFCRGVVALRVDSRVPVGRFLPSPRN